METQLAEITAWEVIIGIIVVFFIAKIINSWTKKMDRK